MQSRSTFGEIGISSLRHLRERLRGRATRSGEFEVLDLHDIEFVDDDTDDDFDIEFLDDDLVEECAVETTVVTRGPVAPAPYWAAPPRGDTVIAPSPYWAAPARGETVIARAPWRRTAPYETC